MKCLNLILLVALGHTVLAGCSNQKPEPLTASSANEAGYAERYPDDIAASRERLTRQEELSRELSTRFEQYPDELNEPSWPHVLGVIERADEAGRGASYAARAEEVGDVGEFYEEEKGDLHKEVGGAGQYTVKQKGYDVDVYSPVVHRMDKTMEKLLEERLREHNEAHRYIEDNADALGKANIEKLEKQADEIAYASYLTHVAVKQTQQSLRDRIEEASDIKSTLDRVIEESNEVSQDPNRSDVDKSTAQKRAEAAQQAKDRVDAEAQQAEQALEQAEERAKKLKEDYDKALDALKKKVEEKAKAAQPS
jgi:hypothetical protein